MISMFRKRTLGPLVLFLVAVFAAPAQANDDCTMSSAKREVLLALPFKQFDQQQGNGWRPLYASKCYIEAALLLKDYVKRNPSIARDQYMLPFHTGQLFALAGGHAEAIQWMENGYSNDNFDPINWNAFVDANVAFLKHDYKALLKQRNLINQEPPMADRPGVPRWAVGKKMNLDVVDGFIACFDKPYDVAYGDECRRRSKKLTNKSFEQMR
jgi:hypothetical protein